MLFIQKKQYGHNVDLSQQQLKAIIAGTHIYCIQYVYALK